MYWDSATSKTKFMNSLSSVEHNPNTTLHFYFTNVDLCHPEANVYIIILAVKLYYPLSLAFFR